MGKDIRNLLKNMDWISEVSVMSAAWNFRKNLSITQMVMNFFLRCMNLKITYGNVNVQH